MAVQLGFDVLAAVALAAVATLGGLIALCALRFRALGREGRRARVFLAASHVMKAFAFFCASALVLLGAFLPVALSLEPPNWLGAAAAVAWYTLVMGAIYHVYRIAVPTPAKAAASLARPGTQRL